MTQNKSPNQFFEELLEKTAIQFEKSPVYDKQKEKGEQWNYSVCATPVTIGKEILFGMNWGGKEINPQEQKMPTGKDIADYSFIKQSLKYLENHLEFNISELNFNYSNLCFFRSPKANDLILEDYKLSLPLFESYVRYINPPWLLSISSSNFNILNKFGLLQNIQSYPANQNKYKGYSAKLWGYDLFSVPHPSAHVTTEARETIWAKVSTEIKKIKT